MRDSTTTGHYKDRKVLEEERDLKIAHGQKEDDHEDQMNYQYRQSM